MRKTYITAAIAAALTFSAMTVSAQEPSAGQAIDLGLSVKWAAWNIGASAPEESGVFYAWGETETKEKFDASNYKYYNGERTAITKYCDDHRGFNGFKDDISRLLPEDDVATVKWGNGWRMPTSEECRELLTKCKWSYIKYKGTEGWLVKGPSGKSIYIVHSGTMTQRGWMDFGTSVPSSDLYPGESWGCDGLYFVRSAAKGQLGLQREVGRCVRAVKD